MCKISLILRLLKNNEDKIKVLIEANKRIRTRKLGKFDRMDSYSVREKFTLSHLMMTCISIFEANDN